MSSNLKGIRLMIQSAFAFSIAVLCAKCASHQIPSLEMVFFRSLFGTVILLAWMIPKKISLHGTSKRGLMILRAFTGFAALTLHFVTIAHLPLGFAVMLNYTSPILAALFAVTFLKEKPEFLLVLMTIVSFSGVYLLVSGSTLRWNHYVAIGLLSAVFAAIAYTLIGAVKKRESPFTIMFYFTSISTLGSLFFLPFGFVWPTPLTWIFLIGIGIGTFYGQLWMTIAFQQSPASVVSPFFYLTPVLSFFYGWIFWKDPVNLTSVLGVFLIIASGTVISFAESKKPKLPMVHE